MTDIKNKLINKIRKTISSHSMLSYGETVLVGLSGGPDSVCLIHLLSELRRDMSLSIYAAYIDHGLRPSETIEEIDFCKGLCEGISIPLKVRSINVEEYAVKSGLSKQEAARHLRYEALEEIAAEVKASKIALGHNADDQVETFFINIIRGTGPAGLSGIPPVRKNIIRPLIETSRLEIEEFLEEGRTEYVIDSSNLKRDYLRNWVRLTLIPELKKVNPSLTDTLTRMMNILREEEGYFDILVTKALIRMITRKRKDYIELFISPMETIEKVLLRRILRRAIAEIRGLRRIGFIHIEGILDLIKKGKAGDMLYLPDHVRVIKSYSTLIIAREPPIRINRYPLPVPGEVFIKETGIMIMARILDRVEDLGDGRYILTLDADRTGKDLYVRARQKGDFFYPLGLGKRKKLQDFFVDEKVPRDERDSIPLVLSKNDIIWVMGFRGDERFKVTKHTKRFLRLEMKGFSQKSSIFESFKRRT